MKKTSFLKRAASLAVVSTFVASLTACGSGSNVNSNLSPDQVSALSTHKDGQKKWTVFVHLAADNNLYGFGLKDMSEMAYGLNSKDVNVVVLFDGAKRGDSAVYEVTHSDKKPAMNAPITSTKVACPLIPSSNEIDSGDAKLLSNFLKWGVEKYPADHYGLIVWNHGSGLFGSGNTIVKPKNAKPNVPGSIHSNGFAWDDSGSNMHTSDIGPILAQANQAAGKKFDVLDFDACLMSHVEIAYQAQPSVNYLVASEKTEAGDGNDYWGIMEALSKNPNMDGKQFASMMVDTYGKSYVPGGHQYTGRPEEYTLAATDTSSVVSDLTPSINALATELAKNPSSAKSAWQSATTYDGDPEPRDWGHFLSLLQKDPKVSGTAKDLAAKSQAALKKAVINETHTGKNDLGDSTGLVIYFPGPGDRLNSDYTNTNKTKFGENTAWVNFLKSFAGSSK